MRISTVQMQTNGVNTMLDRQSDLGKTQQQLATGKRILNPSDDVNGTTQALALKKVISTHEQYLRNADTAENRLNLQEAALTQIIDLMHRVHELAVQSEGTALGATGRPNLAPEVRALLEEMVSLANKTDSNGEYLFAGFNVDTPPVAVTENPPASGEYDYSYTGDSGQRMVQIGSSRQVEVGDPGDDVFFDITISGGGTRNLFETVEQLALDMEANVLDPDAATDVLMAMEHLNVYRSKAGGRQNAVIEQRSFNEDVILHGKTTLSEIQDLDIVEAVSRMNLQLMGLEAAQQSFSRIQNLTLFNFL